MAVDEELPGTQGPNLDVRAALGPSMRDPFAGNCGRFANACEALYHAREKLFAKLGHFLFGAETDLDRWSNDVGAVVRRSLHSAGIGDWATTLLGAAPERPGQHARLQLQRAAGQSVNVEIKHFGDLAIGTSGPEEMPRGLLQSYDAVRISAQHLTVDVAGGEGYPEPVSCSDLTATCAVGSHTEAVEQFIEQAYCVSKVLAWLASDDGHPTQLKVGCMDAFQQTTTVARRLVDMPGVQFSKRQLDPGTVEVCFTLPFNLEEGAEHYPRTAELLGLFNPLELTLRRAGGADATLCTLLVEESVARCCLFFREGRLAWREPGAGAVEWGEGGRLALEATLDVTVVPLGLSLAAIPLPRMKLLCELERRGKLTVTCMEAGEPTYKLAAAAVLDNDLFRKLLLDAFRLELEHTPEEGGQRAVIRFFGRLVFPTSTVAALVAQWFQAFALRQLCELDVVQALADLFAALSQDAAALSGAAPA